MLGNIILIGVAVGIVAAIVGLWYWRRRPRILKPDTFQKQWQELQTNLKDKQAWPEVIMAADKLLDEALKKKHVAGKNMGERLVKAQRMLTDNDSVWFGHKLRGQLDQDPKKRLKEDEVKDALIGIRQALKDLGALPEGKTKNKTAAAPVASMPSTKTKPVAGKSRPAAAPVAPKPATRRTRPTVAMPKRPIRRHKI